MESKCKYFSITLLLVFCWTAVAQTPASNVVTNSVPPPSEATKQFSPEEIQIKIEKLRADAEKGNPEAQNYLGQLHVSGRYVPQDYEQSTRWFRKAAEKGSPAGQFNLGLAFEHGEGVTTNFASAVKWYEKSARQGYPPAQYNLGLIYVRGDKVRKNANKGAALIQKAAWQNDRLAQVGVATLLLNGTGLKTNVVEAYAWMGVVAKDPGFKEDKRVQYHFSEIQRILNPEQLAAADRRIEVLVAEIAKKKIKIRVKNNYNSGGVPHKWAPYSLHNYEELSKTSFETFPPGLDSLRDLYRDRSGG